MKVAHFEDKPGRHAREERKAYIAPVLMANPEYLDSLAPKPFTTEDISKIISIILLVHLSDFGNIFVCKNCENIFYRFDRIKTCYFTKLSRFLLR